MLNVSPTRREYETLPGLNDPAIPAVAPLPTGESEDTERVVDHFGADILASGIQNNQQFVFVKPERLVELAQDAVAQHQVNRLTFTQDLAIELCGQRRGGGDGGHRQGGDDRRDEQRLEDSGVAHACLSGSRSVVPCIADGS